VANALSASSAVQDRSRFTGTTAWARNLPTPLRSFLRTETGGAAVLLTAAAAALLWVNVDARSYDGVWSTQLSIHLGGSDVSLDLRGWVNSGLMTLFFFVVGLEARREFELGELRERRRIVLPALAGLGGAAATVGIYLAFNAGRPSAHGWGVAMSTDTAFALGLLAVVGPRLPDRLRAFLLTVVVVDDLIGLLVIVLAYAGSVAVVPLTAAILFYSVAVVIRLLDIHRGLLYFVVGACAWVALLKAQVDPVVTGLAIGLLALASPAPRRRLEEASARFRAFREQPTAELARAAAAQLRAATPPDERMQQLYHPWSSYVIVPLFALANAGIPISGGLLGRAFGSPITLGILFGYIAGKPIGILGGTWLAARSTRGRLRPPVGWAAVGGAGTVAGIGFTVSVLIATLAFRGDQLEEAKLGILSAGLAATASTWLLFRITAQLPPRLHWRALLGDDEPLTDLYHDVDPERDHIRGPVDAPVTVVEYADFECPFCGQAEPVLRELLRDFTDVRYVWRHLPLTDVHVHAQLAAEAAEAAAEQGAFWELHDLLLDHQDALTADDLIRYAEQLGLDVERFANDLRKRTGATRVADDVDDADLSGVNGTPTFFINGRRHYGAYDIDTLSAAVRAAGARAMFART
jgi:Na+/H+ antiporter NhaA